METLETLREAIHSLFAEWEKLPRIPSDWKIVSVQDTLRELCYNYARLPE